MLKVQNILPDYTTPISHFGLICFICATVSFGSGFMHNSIPLILGVFGYCLIILRTYRRDKRIGVDPFSISFRKRKKSSQHLNDYNKQEVQLATIGGIIMFLSWLSYGFSPYMGEAIDRAIISPLFG